MSLSLGYSKFLIGISSNIYIFGLKNVSRRLLLVFRFFVFFGNDESYSFFF